jgi:antitoxin component HigA of HigAB toxin-antitoxin module
MTKIGSKQQYYMAMAEIEGYLQQGFSSLTEKEEGRLEELSKSVEAWEIKEYPMPMQPSFADILIFIMQNKRYSQSEFSESLSISKSLLSEILNGKKKPNLEIILILHKDFGIDANILMESISAYETKKLKK